MKLKSIGAFYITMADVVSIRWNLLPGSKRMHIVQNI